MARLTVYPIWKNTVFHFTDQTQDKVYGITRQNPYWTYSGTSVKIPDIPNSILVSRIVEDTLPIFDPTTVTRGGWQNTNRIHNYITSTGSDTSAQTQTYSFIRDWSYDDTINYNDYSHFVLNRPVNGKVPDNFYMPIDLYDELKGDYYWNFGGEDDYETSPTYTSSVNFYPTYSLDTFKFYDSSDKLMLQYEICHCWKYAIMYLNRYGAYDIFIIDGNVSKSTDSELSSTAYGKNNVFSNIKTTYKCSTDYMTDEESKRFADNVIYSPSVYLVTNNPGNSGSISDFTSRLLPVSIKDTSVTYKEFRNGKALPQYNFTLEEKSRKISK